MNKIVAVPDKSDYEGYWDYLNYQIDDVFLDDRLDFLYPGNMYKGLIPTLVYWIDREDEKAVVWNRILPSANSSSICPVLMCPDDCDFSCTLIVAQVENLGNCVRWNKIGIDRTKEWKAEQTGLIVDWFDKIRNLVFPMQEYVQMINQFRQRMPIDKHRIEEHMKDWQAKQNQH